MLHNTRGIIFHQVKYSETSIIAKIYTELFGLQSYLIKGIRNKKSAIKPALLQQLTLVDLVVYHKESKNIQHLKEIKIGYPFKTIHTDIRKSSIIIFLNEILYKVIREEEANPSLFKFLYSSIQSLDLMEKSISDFHLIFLIQLTKYLGFFPKNNYSAQNSFFDLQEGVFTNTKESINPGEPFSKYLSELTNTTLQNVDSLAINPIHRNELMDIVLRYYQLHMPVTLNIKSNTVLQTVLND